MYGPSSRVQEYIPKYENKRDYTRGSAYDDPDWEFYNNDADNLIDHIKGKLRNIMVLFRRLWYHLELAYERLLIET